MVIVKPLIMKEEILSYYTTCFKVVVHMELISGKKSRKRFYITLLCKKQNREFNFSNNPTFITGSDGTFRESDFETNPRTYITAIGLMNDSNEVLAVAKTSQPIEKSFDKEVLIKVKLDF